jgi:hypothetical protein
VVAGEVVVVLLLDAALALHPVEPGEERHRPHASRRRRPCSRHRHRLAEEEHVEEGERGAALAGDGAQLHPVEEEESREPVVAGEPVVVLAHWEHAVARRSVDRPSGAAVAENRRGGNRRHPPPAPSVRTVGAQPIEGLSR